MPAFLFEIVMYRSDCKKKLVLFGAGLLLCLLILTAYSNTLYSPFVLDDIHSFVKEQKVLNFTFDLVGFENLARSKFGVRRLLPMLTFVVDVKFGGARMAAFHLTNIIIHILATFSLLFLLQSLMLFPKVDTALSLGDNKNSSIILVIFVVGLWSLSPVQTNAVTYIVQRMTSLTTLFYFLSFAGYLRGRFYYNRDGLTGKTLFFYLLAAIALLCSILSKEIFATWPVMVLLAEWLLVEESGLLRFLQKYKKMVMASVGLFVLLLGFKFYHGWLLGGYGHRHFTLSERLLTELRIVVSYCGILLLPLPRWLNLEHDVALSTSLFSPISTFFSLILIVLIIAAAWKIRDKKPLITFAVVWFFINLLIESTLIPLELKFEHRLYLPSAGFYLALVLLIRELYLYFYGDYLSVDGSKLLVAVAVIICSGLSFLTYTRNIVWADTVSLYQDCIAKAPNKARTHSNLATAWLKKGELEKGRAEAEKAIALGVKGYEEYWVAACDIVSSLNLQDKDQEAIARGERLLEEAPPEAKKNSYPSFLYNLGGAYFSASDFQTAFNYFIKGYKLCYRNNLSVKAADFSGLIVRTLKTGLQQGYQFDLSMKLDSDNQDIDVVVSEKMAQIFFELNNYDLALQFIEKVIEKDSSSQFAHKLKAEIEQISTSNEQQKKMGSLKENYLDKPFTSQFNFFMALAVALEKYNIPLDNLLRYCLKKAETLNNSSADLYIVKSWYFYKLGNYVKALEIIDRGIEIEPNYARLWVNRGIYALAAKKQEAYSDFKKALALYPDYPNRKKILFLQCQAEVLLNKKADIE